MIWAFVAPFAGPVIEWGARRLARVRTSFDGASALAGPLAVVGVAAVVIGAGYFAITSRRSELREQGAALCKVEVNVAALKQLQRDLKIAQDAAIAADIERSAAEQDRETEATKARAIEAELSKLKTLKDGPFIPADLARRLNQ